MLRKARFASPNSFYPDQPAILKNFFEQNTSQIEKKRDVISVICPHAGYIFSAKTALKTLELVKIPDSVVLIGPNHTGYGPPLSVMTEGTWEIPGTTLPVNGELAENLLKNSSFLTKDTTAHEREHSLEVLLPMLHYFNKNISFVPIIMGNYNPQYWEDLGNSLWNVSQYVKNPFLVIASTDMSHFISRIQAQKKDEMAFQKIRELDASGLMEIVQAEKITMCGSGPVASVILYSKRKGAKIASLVDYTDSGLVTGDLDQVVSYASFIIE